MNINGAKFNAFGQYEIPTFVLCNPDKTELFSLGGIYDRKMTIRYNALSELEFSSDDRMTVTENGVERIVMADYYEYLDFLRLVYVEDIGYFMITSVESENQAFIRTKRIKAQSLEVELAAKRINNLNGTFKFSYLTGENTSNTVYLMNDVIMSQLPGWYFIREYDELASLYRTFNVTDKSLYAFLMEDVATAYQCIFTFDTINKVIHATPIAKATRSTGIYLSYQNLVERTNIKMLTDEMITALTCQGGGGLSIRTWNPMGTDTIYNFTYYIDDGNWRWMSQELALEMKSWVQDFENLSVFYSGYAQDLMEKYNYQAEEQTALDAAEVELQALKVELQAAIKAKQSTTVLKEKIVNQESQIAQKKTSIATLQADIENTLRKMQTINAELDFSSRFITHPEYVRELSLYIRGNTYINEAFSRYDSMTPLQEIQRAGELYQQSLSILEKISEPRYEFSIDAANLVFLKEFQPFLEELLLGNTVTVEIQEGVYAYPALLEISLDYENPSNFKMTFGTRMRLDNQGFQFSDLFGSTITNSLKTSFNSLNWSSFRDNYKNDVDTFLNEALDASLNTIINASNQEVVIDSAGILLKSTKQEPGIGSVSGYSPKQLWMTSNLMVFTNDAWSSAQVALGEIKSPTSGETAYGLIADVIVGNLLAGRNLIIQNEDATFQVDGKGATLFNAQLSLVSESGNRILLDPTTGIEIDKRVAINSGEPVYEKQMYIDPLGNLIFKGDISGASGYFSGSIIAKGGKIGLWEINDKGLVSSDGSSYIYGDGNVQLGSALSIDVDSNPPVFTFNGNIYASNLVGPVQGYQLANINACSINAGTLRGIDIYGKTIYWPHTKQYESGTGNATIESTRQIDLVSYGNGTLGAISISPTRLTIFNQGEITIGDGTSSSNTNFQTNIFVDGLPGITGTFLL